MSTYFYRDKAGREIGPFDLATLSKFRMAGVLDGDTPIRLADSAEWKPCREVIADPQITPTSSQPAPPASGTAGARQNKWVVFVLAALAIFIFIRQRNSNNPSININGARTRTTPSLVIQAPQPLSKEEEKIACVNQLKQIGIAFRIWEGDNQDQYPFNLSANAGGTKEFCSVGSDGFDKNAFLHFQVMSNELNTTKILVCPSDNKHPAIDFAHLRPENLSYQLRSGVDIRESNPSEILAICPIHHNVVYCDGSVAQLPNEMWELVLSNIRQAKAVSQANACINNLRQIDAAAQQWALEKGKTTGSLINFPSDLTPYIKLTADGKIPSCPAGGIYTINRVGDTPTCSLGTTVIPNHVLP